MQAAQDNVEIELPLVLLKSQFPASRNNPCGSAKHSWACAFVLTDILEYKDPFKTQRIPGKDLPNPRRL